MFSPVHPGQQRRLIRKGRPSTFSRFLPACLGGQIKRATGPISGKFSTPYALQASLWLCRKRQGLYWLQAPFSLPLEERDET